MAKPFALSFALISTFGVSCAPASPSRAPALADCHVDQSAENPLHDARRILDMQVLTKKGRRGNPLADSKQGVVIVIRPERGLTLEWLSHVIECDQAGQHAEATATCPLALPTAQAAVDSTQGHLVVYVRYTDPSSIDRAAELARRFHATRAD